MGKYDKEIEAMKPLAIGQTIVAIKEFDRGSFDSGIMIILSNGMKITGQDGEYGDNTLDITPEEE
jgi:hypothetical protein